jgi:tRNA nucleotidyltransferase (CCA-adding enzyme)
MDLITTHINADFDCLGAMVAAKLLYPQAEMVFPGAQERNLREFFVRSTLYAYDFKRIKDVDLDAVTRLILVDVCQPERIGPFGVVARRPGVEVHIYDHHPGAPTVTAQLTQIEPVGATVTVFAHLFMQQNIRPPADIATLMMLGLYEDTGSLLFHSTTEKDYAAAAFLLSCGAELNTVADFLTQEMTAAQVSLLHELLGSREVLTVNGIEISITHASCEQFVGDLAVLAHKLKEMENLDSLIVAVRMVDRIFLVGRSRVPEVDVGVLLSEFGGGGHAYAASATVRDLTLVQVLDKLPALLARQVHPQWQARHLMSAPVKTVEASAPLRSAREILLRYNLNALPVVANSVVVGVIGRQIVDKATHHKLEEAPVSNYMATDVLPVTPETPFQNLQELIVVRHQRILPVVDAGALVGVVTRTDLLRHMVSGGGLSIGPQSVDSGGRVLGRRQLVRRMSLQLPARLIELLRTFGHIGDDLQVKVYAVGGFVRDLLLQKENLDVDIVVEGDGIAFARAVEAQMPCRVRPHAKFGTAVIIFDDGFKVDVASTRMEYYLEPGALPNVEHASIKLDLYRRDFTINTLAVALNSEDFGDLLDFFQAQKDLRDKAVRVLHNLSFVEDPTRVFRAIRFEQRLKFSLGRHTEALLRSAVQMGFVDRVGGVRVYNELQQILREDDPVAPVQRMAGFGLLSALHPALQWSEACGERLRAAGRAVHWYDLLYTSSSCRGWLVSLLCLLTDLTGPQVQALCRRLAVPPRERTILVHDRRRAHDNLRRLERALRPGQEVKASQLHRWLQPLSIEALVYLLARSTFEPVRQAVSHYVTHLRGVTPLLDGHALRRLGLPPGPVYNKVFNALLVARLDGLVLSREDELALVRRRFARLLPPKK